MEHLLCALHGAKHFTSIISNLIFIPKLGEVLQPSLVRGENHDPEPLVTYPRPQAPTGAEPGLESRSRQYISGVRNFACHHNHLRGC